MSPLDEEGNGAIPTEEIYLELQELEELRAAADAYVDPAEAVPVVSSDDPSSIKARIARLRAMLSDRGASPDH